MTGSNDVSSPGSTSFAPIDTVGALLDAARREGLRLVTSHADFDRSGLAFLVVHAHDEDGVPWIEAGKLNAGTLPDGVDLICAAHSHDFIGRKTRERARLGAIGYHPSLLPLHRGRDAIVWTLHMGERVTGGTIYWMNDIMDGGDIAAQEHIFIPPGATPGDLWRDQLFPLGLKLYEKVLADLEQGVIVRQPQNHDLATWEPSWDRPPLKRRPGGRNTRRRRGYGIGDHSQAFHRLAPRADAPLG